MVEYMRSTVAFALVFGNIIIASLNIYFSIKAMDNNPYNYLRLLEINPNYYIKDIFDKEIDT